MTFDIKNNTLYSVEEIEKAFSDLVLVYKVGKGDWADSLYYIPSESKYLEKGPFGSHDAVCFRVCSFRDVSGAIEWKEKAEAYWKAHYPKIKLDPS